MTDRDHILIGLEPDNLLAFLALLGFMRAIDRAEPEWRLRAFWAGLPYRPQVRLAVPVERSALLEAAARGCVELAKAHDFGGRVDLDYSREQARRLLEEAARDSGVGARDRADVLSSLMSDGVVRGDDRVKATAFCAMFGQGHQHFLERLADVPNGVLSKDLAKEKRPPDLNAASYLESALFASWSRADKTHSFRWDPAEDRRYALRFESPSGDKGLTVHGANRLAAVALPLLPSVPTHSLGEIRLTAVSAAWAAGGTIHVRWPIWTRPATLRAVKRLLTSCDGCGQLPDTIAVLESARITAADRYVNFTRATSIAP